MTIGELCTNPRSYLAVFAMLLLIPGLGLIAVNILLSRITSREYPVLTKGGRVFVGAAILLIIMYLAIPTIISLLIWSGLIEPISMDPCSPFYVRTYECNMSYECDVSSEICGCLEPMDGSSPS